MPAGRPTDYCQETVSELCALITEGQSLRSICLLDHMPSLRTVFNWLGRYAEFVQQYELARAAQADTYADEITDIADDGSNDWMERRNKDGDQIGWMINGEAVNRSRLRVDARKWIASKLKPKKYGEKLDIDHAGAVSIQVITGVPADA